MRRLLACLLATSAASLGVGACDSPTAITADVGSVVALDSLRTADAAALPCCTVDTAGGRVTIVGGTLTFRNNAHYTDTAFTPGGAMSAACVTEVPNGAFIHANGLVTVGDSVAYLVIPCHVGTYTFALSQRLDLNGGSSRTVTVTVSSGAYAWKRDTLSLAGGAVGALAVTLSVDTVVVVAAGHTYKFQAVAVY